MFDITRSTLTLFGFEMHWYGILIAVGVFLAVCLAEAREKKLGLPRDTALNVALIAVPAALICARLYYVAFSWEYYAAHPREILNFRQGGLAVYGGIMGGVLAGYLYCRVKKLSFCKGLDLVAPSLALGQAVGRWGNFLNQEAYGRIVTQPALQFFPAAVWIEGSGWHYATFFYESVWCALIMCVILIAERKHFFRRDGDAFGAYLLFYGIERTLVEGLRTDSLYLGPVRISQLLSVGMVLFVCIILAVRAGRASAAVRLLPAGLCLLFGAAVFLNWSLIAVVTALLTGGAAAAVYNISNNSSKLQET